MGAGDWYTLLDVAPRSPLREALREICLSLGGGCEEAIRELEAAGAKRLVEAGRLVLGGHRVLGKGWAGVVVLVETRDGSVAAAKLRRPGSRRPSLLSEAAAWLAASALGAAPRLLHASPWAILYEPVLGPSLREYRPRSGAEAAKTLRLLLLNAYLLDAHGLRHNELARPEEQVVVEARTSRPYIIDYESATWGSPGNLTQLVGGLPRTPLGRACRVEPGSPALRPLLRRYKHEGPAPRLYSEIAGLLAAGCHHPAGREPWAAATPTTQQSARPSPGSRQSSGGD